MPDRPLDVLVIGGGQAGLAVGYRLKDTVLSFQIVEAEPCIRNSRRRRYRSLTLITPRAFSGLPGLPMTGDRDGYPTRHEFADYLESYATSQRNWRQPTTPCSPTESRGSSFPSGSSDEASGGGCRSSARCASGRSPLSGA